jgi:hypothetical protein
MQTKSSPTAIILDPSAPSAAFGSVPAHMERKIAARWKEWEAWMIVHLRQRHYDSISTELARLRQRHRQDVLSVLDLGIEMRLIRKHKLDDPRITDEARTLVLQAALGRGRNVRASRSCSAHTSSGGLPKFCLGEHKKRQSLP